MFLNMESFEQTGEWWIASKPDKTIGGTLKFDSQEGIELKLSGSFELVGSKATREWDIIHGFIVKNGAKVTLHNCFQTSSSFAPAVGVSRSSVYAQTIFIGEHFHSSPQIRFSEMSIYFSGIGEWISTTGIKTHTRKISPITYKLPTAITLHKRKNRHILFYFSATQIPYDTEHKITLKEKTLLTIEFKRPQPFERFRDLFLYLHNFISMGLCIPLPISELYGYKMPPVIKRKKKSYRPRIEIFYPMVLNRRATKHSRHPASILFSFSEIKNSPEKNFGKWLHKGVALEPIHNLFFGTMHRNFIIIENYFLSMVQSIEALHKQIHRDNKKPMSLKSRLTDIFVQYKKIGDLITKDSKTMINDIIISRSYYTHYDRKQRKKATHGNDLFQLAKRLEFLILAPLLKVAGFRKREIVKLMTRHIEHGGKYGSLKVK